MAPLVEVESNRRDFLCNTGVYPAMKGAIEFANPPISRYGVRTEAGAYTVFQLLGQGVAMLEIGDKVEGDLEAPALQIYRINGGGNVNVFAEKTRLTRSAAMNWVSAAGELH